MEGACEPWNRDADKDVAGSILTPRETEVLQLVAQGKARKEIAVALDISDRTAQFHIQNVLRTFNVSTRLELLALLRG